MSLPDVLGRIVCELSPIEMGLSIGSIGAGLFAGGDWDTLSKRYAYAIAVEVRR